MSETPRVDALAALIQREKGAEYPRVQGRCPTCGCESLFLGDGGYVTCSWVECTRPDHASDLLAASSPDG